jgi:hypothetical protein
MQASDARAPAPVASGMSTAGGNEKWGEKSPQVC